MALKKEIPRPAEGAGADQEGGVVQLAMERRRFLAMLAGGMLAAPLAAEGQPTSKIANVGLLTPAAPAGSTHFVAAFRQGLQELGYVERKTLDLEVRYGEGKPERISEMARELVALKLDVIAVSTDLAIAAVKRETPTLPIVMTFSIDPVATGFVSSLARPGGNITGLSNVAAGLSGKRLALLREAVPALSRVAFLWNPDLKGESSNTGKRRRLPARCTSNCNPSNYRTLESSTASCPP
jgi:putative ABC transport system substrate-binding protein